MTIHHSILKKAEKLGVILTEITAGQGDLPYKSLTEMNIPMVMAFWPKHNVYTFGTGEKLAKAAMDGMEALIAIKEEHPSYAIVNKVDDPFFVQVYSDTSRDLVHDRFGTTPSDALATIDSPDFGWLVTTVPLDGGEAHKAGFPITDNPYDGGEDTGDEYAAWDEAWEASADEASSDEAADDEVGGSVVSERYRQKYAEEGHPNHCGDWLAVTLINLTGDTKTFNVEKFEAICALNNVNTSKYKREGTGWAGRIRMTGRNMLAKQVYLSGGILEVGPHGVDGITTLRAPADWMASRKYKGKKAEPVIAEPVIAEPAPVVAAEDEDEAGA